MAQPRWMEIANGELGQTEIAGPEDNPRIVAYHQATSLRAQDDETPWCASFVNWALRQAGLPATNSAAARSFEHWGRALDEPPLGCVVVLWRGSRSAPTGHVGFYAGEANDGGVLLLGGNQGNQVSVRSYPRDRVLGYRWPAGVELPTAVKPLSESREIRGAAQAGGLAVATGGVAVVAPLIEGRAFEWWQIAVIVGVVLIGGTLAMVIRARVGKRSTERKGFVT